MENVDENDGDYSIVRNQEIIDDYSIIKIQEIINKSFDADENLDDAEYLAIGSSGGFGHIAAIKAIIGKYRAKFRTTYPLTPYNEKPISATGLSIFAASYASYFPFIEPLLNSLNLPCLPKHETLMGAVNQLKSEELLLYIDMLLHVMPYGYESAALWNYYQREDKKDELMKLVALQEQNDAAAYPFVHKYFSSLLSEAHANDRPYSALISTQVVGLAALCDVVIEYNRSHNTNIIIHQYMTDLPTDGAVHFFGALSRLSEEQQQVMKLYAVGLEQQTLRKFFVHTNFNGLYNIDPKDNPMVRSEFMDSANDNSQKFSLPVTINAATDSIKQFTCQNENLVSNVSTSMTIPADAKIASIMLGSQARQDTVSYISDLIANDIDKIFVFGGSNIVIANRIKDLLKEHPDWEDKIVLLDKQEAACICALETRSDIMIMSPGGLSVMEQMAMNHNPNQKIFIHCPDAEGSENSSGIPWEDCQRKELIEKLKDQITIAEISPSSASKVLKECLQNAQSNFNIS